MPDLQHSTLHAPKSLLKISNNIKNCYASFMRVFCFIFTLFKLIKEFK